MAEGKSQTPTGFEISLPAELLTIIGLHTVPSTTLELMAVTADSAREIYRGRVFWRNKTLIERRGLVFDEGILKDFEVSWYLYYRFSTKREYGTAAIWDRNQDGPMDLQPGAHGISSGDSPDGSPASVLLVLTPDSVDPYAVTFYSIDSDSKRDRDKIMSARKLDQYTIHVPGVVAVTSFSLQVGIVQVILLKENGDLFNYNWCTGTQAFITADVVDLIGTGYLGRDGIARNFIRATPFTPIVSLGNYARLGWSRSGDTISNDGLVQPDRADPFGVKISGKHYVGSVGNTALDLDGTLYYYSPVMRLLTRKVQGFPMTKSLGEHRRLSVALIH